MHACMYLTILCLPGFFGGRGHGEKTGCVIGEWGLEWMDGWMDGDRDR